jgi:hypothetical protein
MRKFDFVLQTVLLVLAAAFLGAGLLVDKGFFIWIGILQFFIGCQQLLSAFATVANNRHGNAWRTRAIRIYWICVAAYFVLLAVLYVARMQDLAITWFFCAWAIAVYYYVFTIRLAFGTPPARKTFLDIVN